MKTTEMFVQSIIGIAMLCSSGHAWAQSNEAGDGISERQTLTGKWGGLRTEWAAHGIHAEGNYIGDIFANLDGGRDEGAEHLDIVELKLLLDMSRLSGWRGGSVLLSGLYGNGGSVGRHVGDVQGVNNIEGARGLNWYEAWVQQNLLSNRLSLLVGMYDINSEFDVMQSAALFINSSHGIGAEFAASGLAGPPIYPFPALSVRLKTLLSRSLYVQTVVSDGVSGNPDDSSGNAVVIRGEEGAFVAGEIGWYLLDDGGRLDSEDGSSRAHRRHIGREIQADYRLKLALGGWRYTSKFEQLRRANSQGPAPAVKDNGIYALLDWKAYREAEDDSQGLSTFLRLGVAENHASRFNFYWGTGVVYAGLIPGRDKDRMGLALAMARNSDYAKSTSSQPLDDAETTLEFTYRTRVTPWLAFQPNLQYVINPGTLSTLPNALVIGARFEVNL